MKMIIISLFILSLNYNSLPVNITTFALMMRIMIHPMMGIDRSLINRSHGRAATAMAMAIH